MNRLAAPGGGHEEFRSFVDIHRRSIGEPQHRVGPRARADRLTLANGGACVERARCETVQTAVGGSDRRSRSGGSHHAVDGAACEIDNREEQRGCCGKRAPLHPAGRQGSRHRDDRPFALHLCDSGAAGRAAAEMVFHQQAAAAPQLVT